MKKIILILLFSSFLYADANFYFGGGYAVYNENIKGDADHAWIDDSSTNNSGIIKVGYGGRNSYSIEFCANYIDNTKTDLRTWKAKYGFDISLIKAFDFNIYVNPFLKAGFGAGMIDNSDNDLQSKTYGSFNIGGGVYIPLSEHYDIELNYTYEHLSYQKSDELKPTNFTSDANSIYIGINFRL